MSTRTGISPLAWILAVILAADLSARYVQAKPAAPPPRVLTAEEFRLVDSEGKLRGRLAVAQSRPGLAFYSSDGKTPRAIFAITASGDPILGLLDRDGKTPRATLDLTD